MDRYLSALVWALRIVALGLFVTTLQTSFYALQAEPSPFAWSASAAFATVALPLLLAGAAEILALLRKTKSAP